MSLLGKIKSNLTINNQQNPKQNKKPGNVNQPKSSDSKKNSHPLSNLKNTGRQTPPKSNKNQTKIQEKTAPKPKHNFLDLPKFSSLDFDPESFKTETAQGENPEKTTEDDASTETNDISSEISSTETKLDLNTYQESILGNNEFDSRNKNHLFNPSESGSQHLNSEAVESEAEKGKILQKTTPIDISDDIKSTFHEIFKTGKIPEAEDRKILTGEIKDLNTFGEPIKTKLSELGYQSAINSSVLAKNGSDESTNNCGIYALIGAIPKEHLGNITKEKISAFVHKTKFKYCEITEETEGVQLALDEISPGNEKIIEEINNKFDVNLTYKYISYQEVARSELETRKKEGFPLLDGEEYFENGIFRQKTIKQGEKKNAPELSVAIFLTGGHYYTLLPSTEENSLHSSSDNDPLPELQSPGIEKNEYHGIPLLGQSWGKFGKHITSIQKPAKHMASHGLRAMGVSGVIKGSAKIHSENSASDGTLGGALISADTAFLGLGQAADAFQTAASTAKNLESLQTARDNMLYINYRSPLDKKIISSDWSIQKGKATRSALPFIRDTILGGTRSLNSFAEASQHPFINATASPILGTVSGFMFVGTGVLASKEVDRNVNRTYGLMNALNSRGVTSPKEDRLQEKTQKSIQDFCTKHLLSKHVSSIIETHSEMDAKKILSFLQSLDHHEIKKLKDLLHFSNKDQFLKSFNLSRKNNLNLPSQRFKARNDIVNSILEFLNQSPESTPEQRKKLFTKLEDVRKVADGSPKKFSDISIDDLKKNYPKGSTSREKEEFEQELDKNKNLRIAILTSEDPIKFVKIYAKTPQEQRRKLREILHFESFWKKDHLNSDTLKTERANIRRKLISEFTQGASLDNLEKMKKRYRWHKAVPQIEGEQKPETPTYTDILSMHILAYQEKHLIEQRDNKRHAKFQIGHGVAGLLTFAKPAARLITSAPYLIYNGMRYRSSAKKDHRSAKFEAEFSEDALKFEREISRFKIDRNSNNLNIKGIREILQISSDYPDELIESEFKLSENQSNPSKEEETMNLIKLRFAQKNPIFASREFIKEIRAAGIDENSPGKSMLKKIGFTDDEMKQIHDDNDEDGKISKLFHKIVFGETLRRGFSKKN